MGAEVVQTKYEELDAIARRFAQQAQANRALQQQVQRGVAALRNGGWEGRGAAAFFGEMEQRVFPVMARLTNALAEAQVTTLVIKDLIRQAEEEAANALRGADHGSANNTHNGGLIGDPMLAELAGAPMWNNGPLVARDPGTLFHESYMKDLIGKHFRGEDSPELNRLMEKLGQNPQGAELEATLNRLADIRGVSRSEFRVQYEKYLEVRAQAEKLKGPTDAIDLTKHGDFLGSTASLRYGKVVGDAFGIDPVFGSLLNPTGGMVGAGNSAYNPADDSPIGMHGIVHDAAGYLYNYHNLGPGYDYLGLEPSRNTADPLTGQRGGITWWLKQHELDAPGPDFVLENPIIHGALGTVWDVAVLDGKQVLTGIGQSAGALVDGNWRAFGQGMQQALDGVARVPVDIGTGVVRTIGDTMQETGGVVVNKISNLLGM